MLGLMVLGALGLVVVRVRARSQVALRTTLVVVCFTLILAAMYLSEFLGR
jgi:hypothetical protein